VRIDLRKARLDVLVSLEEIDRRRSAFERAGGYRYPASQTPWQEIQRALVGQLENGASLKGATEYQRIAQTRGLLRDNH
jgi:dihydroxy-acid dehydratase